MDTTVYRHLQKVSDADANATLDWAIAQSEDGNSIRIRHGKAGSGTKLCQIPASAFSHARGAQQEVTERVLRKAAEGYRDVGFSKADGRGILKNARSERDPASEFHWMASDVDIVTVERAVADICCALLNAGIDCENDGLSFFLGTARNPRWAIVLTSGSKGDCSGGGVVYPTDGPIPVLVVMALAKKCGSGFAVADGSGNEVDMRFSRNNRLLTGLRWEVQEDIADALGLCVKLNFNEGAGGIIF